MEKFFRHRKTGVIYPFNDRLLNNITVELVTEEQAFPERFAAKAVLEHKKQVDITIAEEVVAPPFTPPELGAQLGEKFKNVVMTSPTKKQKSKVGLEL
jgi:hypothetical protein